MSERIKDDKRDFLKGVALAGAAAGVVAAGSRPAFAQMLDSGVPASSVLAKCRKEGVLRVGYAQTGPWFYKDAKTGEIGGIYKDVVDQLCHGLEVKPDYKEVTFATSTVALRSGDYDLFGSSLTYTMPRAITVNYIGPLYAKGSLLVVRKEDAGKYKTAADFNQPDVTFSVVAGGSEEPRIPVLWPKAKLITTTGQVYLGAEPVRARRATVWMCGDSDALLFAKRNSDWAVVIDPDHPIDRRPNTWAIRYGDAEWKQFLDMFGAFLVANGEMDRLFKFHMQKLGA